MDPRPELRASDSERAATLQHLQDALAHGRITLSEFDERSRDTSAAITLGQLAAVTADLPGTTPAVPQERLELGRTIGSVKRSGNWRVPQELVLRARFGSVELDLSEAEIPHEIVTVDVDVIAGSIEMRLPEGASAGFAQLDVMFGSTEDHRRSTGTGPHFEFRGRVLAGSVELRGPKRRLFAR
ncbi:DUF1707 domain-containing protein [Pseudonocardia ailaonensis]|uniref:DUF1707 domain-containing protein n=1 Tax=Pseudonocardia ailaonensis TaxID=367279 RepID=A0ABN2NAW3_9PSEU